MKRICIVVSTLFTARAFLFDQIAQLRHRYDVSIAANGTNDALLRDLGVTLIHVPIVRRISPVADLRALLALYRLFRSSGFDAVHSFTPKAGLLAMLASCAARVPVRMHTFTGQVWATRSGAGRLLLKTMDRLIAAAATHVMVDSASQRDFLQREGVLDAGRGEVPARGSVSGVDPVRFKPDAAARAAVRGALGVSADAIVFVFVGRLGVDKGVLDLARAFAIVARTERHAHLVLVGPDEEGLATAIAEAAGEAAPRVHCVGMSDTPERHLAAGDIFCLPSYREGFGSSIIEAAAAGMPAIGTRIYGIVDAIEDGVTGLLVPPRDIPSLAAAMLRLGGDEALRHALGAAARKRALADFSQAAVTAAILAFYERVLPAAPERAP